MDAPASERVVKAKALLRFETDVTIEVTGQKETFVDISEFPDQLHAVIKAG